MANVDISLVIENISAELNFDYMESFESRAHIDGDTQPITLGSVSEPELIIVVGDRPGIGFTIGAGTDVIGAYPCGVWANVGGTPNAADTINISGSGECVIKAYGDA
ncbi:MAG: hypothetical protein GY832_15400 [Chloroflexi bacterium]|nr:hypothetical protein [Chloroflexota bacterium]